jgi:K+-sensing histidine kinase KdpD
VFAAGAATGVGLGLPTAAAIVALLHGKLDARAQQHSGTDLRITIPVRPAPAAVPIDRETRVAP